MVRKNRLPQFPDDYINNKAEEYNNSKWMERNQKRTTILCLKYLFNKNLDSIDISGIKRAATNLVLDLGCGTGFSSEILIQNGFRVVGIDILNDMLINAREKKKLLKNYNALEYVLADINYLPLKNNKFDYIFSISSYNFITYGLENFGEKVTLLNNTARYLYKVLKEKGGICIEFYPKNEKELKMFNKSFINNGFEGYMIKNNPHQKSGQTYLILTKKTNNGNL